MAITRGYATLAEFKARLARAGASAADDPTRDAVMEDVIEAASREVDSLTGSFFYPTTAETRYVSAEASDRIDVDPLRTITALRTDADGDGVYETTWATTDYRLLPVNAATAGEPYTALAIRPLGRYGFPRGEALVELVGDWGWATVPHAVREATLILALRLWMRPTAPFGIAGSTELGTATYIPGKDHDVLTLLAPYRRFVIGAV